MKNSMQNTFQTDQSRHRPIFPRIYAFVLVLFFVLSACKDEDEKISPVPTNPLQTKGLYVLNEGLFNQNNTTLTYYDLSTKKATTDFFETTNGRKLGDSGNDLKVYGSKLYVVVNGSSQLQVMDLKTGKSLKQIPMFATDQTPRQPRYIASHKGYVYVCSFDGTVGRLDTANLVFDKFITVGRQPDGICVANDKLYISNSGGLDYPNYDHTVSVVNTATFQEIKEIEVDLNPYIIQADSYGDVYVVCRGNYADVGYSFQAIDSQTDQIKKKFEGLEALNFTIQGDSAYLYNYNYTTQQTSIHIVNVKTEEIVSDKFITDNTKITTPYGIDVDPSNGDVYITDAYDFTVTGDVYCFSKEGKLKFTFEAGLNPNTVVFLQE